MVRKLKKKYKYIPPKEAAKKLLKMRSPVVTLEADHKGKKHDYVVTYPDGSKEAIDVKSKYDKAKIDLQLSIDKLQVSSKGITLGNTSDAMKLIKKWRQQVVDINEKLLPKGFDESFNKTSKLLQKSIHKEQKALTGIMGLKILEKFYDKPRSITTKPITGNTILTGGIASLQKTMPIRPPKPQAHAREAMTGAGMRRFMELMKIDNPVLIAKKYPKNQKALSISGFINLRFLCESMNVSVEDAFLYICEGMQKSNKRWLKHRIELEFFRGSTSIENLVKYYREKIEHNKSKHLAKYTLKQLMASDYFNKFCKENVIEFKSYEDFTRYFKKWKHHVEVLIDNKPKGLLN